MCIHICGLPRWPSDKEPSCKCRRHKRCGFNPWAGKIPWRRACKPLYTANSFSCVHLFVTLWNIAHQAPMFMGILQERIVEWVAMPSSEDLPNPGIEPVSLTSPALAPPGKPHVQVCTHTHTHTHTRGERERRWEKRKISKTNSK